MANYAFTLVRKMVKVIQKNGWIGEREKEGRKAFSFNSLSNIVSHNSCSESQIIKLGSRSCVSQLTISYTSGRCDECGNLLTLPPNAVHEQ